MQIENENGFWRIADLLSRYIAGVQTEKEERELYAWNGKEGREEVFGRLCEQVRKRMHHVPEQEWETAFARFERRRHFFRLRRRMRRWGGVAAAMAVVCIGGYFFQENVLHKGVSSEMAVVADVEVEGMDVAPLLSTVGGDSWLLVDEEEGSYSMYDSIMAARGRVNGTVNDTLTISVPACSDYHLVLEDGTKVWINADSKVVYPAHFGKGSREIKVEGEVFLEVAKDKSRPFCVEAGGMKIEVLGTSFNVNAYEQLEVTLVSGAVKAVRDDGGWRLQPGQQLAVEKTGVKVREVNVMDYVCWRNGIYVFKKKSLEDIAKALRRWYGKEVVFLDERKKNEIFTGILDKDVGVDVFMNQLSQSSGIKFVVSGNQLFIK